MTIKIIKVPKIIRSSKSKIRSLTHRILQSMMMQMNCLLSQVAIDWGRRSSRRTQRTWVQVEMSSIQRAKESCRGREERIWMEEVLEIRAFINRSQASSNSSNRNWFKAWNNLHSQASKVPMDKACKQVWMETIIKELVERLGRWWMVIRLDSEIKNKATQQEAKRRAHQWSRTWSRSSVQTTSTLRKIQDSWAWSREWRESESTHYPDKVLPNDSD